MTHDQPRHEYQMTRLMEQAMLPVTASDDLVAAGLSRGRRATRRRRTAQAVGVGASAALATAVAVAAPSLGGSRDARQLPVATSAGAPTTAADPTREPSPSPTSDPLPPHLQRAQELLLDSLRPAQPGYTAITRVGYDPDGRGNGEILAIVSPDSDDITRFQPARCEQVNASSAPDACLDTGDGWIFTGPSTPDISGRAAGLAGTQATYILRDGRIVTLTAYNAPKVLQGGEPTRPDPVLDADELTTLVTETAWFG